MIMKNKIKLSMYCRIVTAIMLILFVAGAVSLAYNRDKEILFCVIFGAVIISGLYFGPKSVEADEDGLTVYRHLAKPKRFAYDDIETIETFYPSAGGLRLCGSGGFCGYWGYFNDIMAGTYFGCYGSRSHCFLVRLKNGGQYVIGCEDPEAFVEYVKEHK